MKNPPKLLLDPAMCEAFLYLSREKAGDLIRAIVSYFKTRDESGIPGELIPYFAQFKASILINDEHWKETSEKNTQNGKKGGAPKGNQNARKKDHTYSTTGASFNIDDYSSKNIE